jgi:hypothetical protein
MQTKNKILIVAATIIVFYLVYRFFTQLFYPDFTFGLLLFWPILLPFAIAILFFAAWWIVGVVKKQITNEDTTVPELPQKDYLNWLLGIGLVLILLYFTIPPLFDWFIQKGYFGLGGH